ncbi:MAG: hypothetical protein RRC34_04290 [Lentisphaeria bacterium]|nr:hypothetical protein [Lentisphaeria bacterium]
MWANHVKLIGILLFLIVLASAFTKVVSGRLVGILTMAAGALTIFMAGVIGGTGPGLKDHLGIGIAGAILFGCGVIAVAVGPGQRG